MSGLMIYGYARVSTVHQSLEEQEKTLRANGCDIVFSEHFTGTTKERPKFSELLSVVESGDKIIVTKLDRFSRSTTDAVTLIRELHEKGVVVQILNMGAFDNTPMGRIMLTMLAGFAEFERDMIVERTQVGREIARQREGYRDGRKPKFGKKKLDHAIELKKTHSYKQVDEMTGISESTLRREIRRREAQELLEEKDK